jgi:uncharacterized repeat protein (TIGR03803 family)
MPAFLPNEKCLPYLATALWKKSLALIRIAFLNFKSSASLILFLLPAAGLFLLLPPANAQAQLWGMTSGGGKDDAGVIFQTDASGNNLSVQYNLFQHEGAKPLFTNLIQASDSLFYGMTYKGGTNDSGILFQYNPATSAYIKKIDFDGATNGSKPLGSLVQANDGLLYGMTYKGGAYHKGVLFQYNPATSVYTKKIDFDGLTIGCYPHGSLIQATDGNLYGMTVEGGTNNMGTLFRYNPSSSTFTHLLDFAGAGNGSYPLGSLMQAGDGNLYGMTCMGGTNDMGVLFQYNPVTNSYSNRLNFTGPNGNSPLGFLIEASDGALYGMTNSGGANDKGVLFRYNPVTFTSTTKFDFDGMNGSYPQGSLMQANDGMLYGMTGLGGMYDQGVLFQYNPALSTLTRKIDFAGSTSGRSPYGTLMQARDGKLYGMTNTGGVNGIGVLFQYDPVNSAYVKKFDFGASNGRNPHGSMIRANNGNFYGLTYGGGANDVGVLFQYNPIGSIYTDKFDFDGIANGGNPTGSLTQAANGMLYGLTYTGGANGMGVLFQYDPASSTYVNKFDFDGITNGSYPRGSLISASDGNLYGMTSKGGANDRGVLFQFNPGTSALTNTLDFSGATNGSYPQGSLSQTNDGMLYGMTVQGGADDMGVLFQYNPSTLLYTKKIDFGNANGKFPYGSLLLATDGNLYGMTNKGGANDFGVLFQYNPTNSSYTRKFDFDGAANGSNPLGSLIQPSDGKLYGLTYSGGTNDVGVLFQYDPSISLYVKKTDCNAINGKHPSGDLTEINATAGLFNYAYPSPTVLVSPSPNNGSFTVQSTKEGVYSIVNTLGQTMRSFKLDAINNYSIRIENMNKGIYSIVGFTNDHTVQQKVMVIK